jgi:hypothetical protein
MRVLIIAQRKLLSMGGTGVPAIALAMSLNYRRRAVEMGFSG